jgi:serine/threonine-protein kinase
MLGQPGITRGGVFLGTPNYASPEQAKLLPLDERSDLYALGVVVFEMVTGRRPFVAEGSKEVLEMHKSTPPPDPLELVPNLPIELSRIILRCLEKDPSRRYPNAGALRDAIESLES